MMELARDEAIASLAAPVETTISHRDTVTLADASGSDVVSVVVVTVSSVEHATYVAQ